MLGHSWVPVTFLIVRLIQFSSVISQWVLRPLYSGKGEFFTTFVELGLLLPIMMYKSLFDYLAVLLINFNCGIQGKIIHFGNSNIFVYFTTNFTRRLTWGKSQNFLRLFTFPHFWFCFCFLGASNTGLCVWRHCSAVFPGLGVAYVSSCPLAVCQSPAPVRFPCVAVLWLSRVSEPWVTASGPSNSGRKSKILLPWLQFSYPPRSCARSKSWAAWAWACFSS